MDLHLINHSQKTSLMKQILALQAQRFYAISFFFIKYLWMSTMLATAITS